jgi:hypothetical protein
MLSLTPHAVSHSSTLTKSTTLQHTLHCCVYNSLDCDRCWYYRPLPLLSSSMLFPDFFFGVKAIVKTGPTKCFPWYNEAMSRDDLSPLIASGRLDLQNWIPVMPNADSVPRFCGSSMTWRSSTGISTWLPLRRLTENRTTARKDIRESCDEVHQSIKESREVSVTPFLRLTQLHKTSGSLVMR